MILTLATKKNEIGYILKSSTSNYFKLVLFKYNFLYKFSIHARIVFLYLMQVYIFT